MTTTSKKKLAPGVSSEEHKAAMYRIALEVNARAGIPEKPTRTPEEMRASMLARGIKPEDNILSQELLRMRYGDDYDQDEYIRQLDEQNKKE